MVGLSGLEQQLGSRLRLYEMSGMHLTLSSNVYGDESNVNGDYVTRLKRPLLLEGGQWEVGLTGIVFTNSWFNIFDGQFHIRCIPKAHEFNGVEPKSVFMRLSP